MRKVLLILAMLSCTLVGKAQNRVDYWFDQQTERAAYTSGEIDCSALATGLHFVHFQIKDAEGKASPVQSGAFFLINESIGASPAYSAINYWFDQQTGHTAYTSGNIDCSALTNGLHAIHFQLIDKDNKPSPVHTGFFLILDSGDLRLCYWFDDSATRNMMDIDDTEINVESLSYGHHTLHAVLVDAQGNTAGNETMTANFTIVCPENEHTDADGDGVCDLCDEQFTTSIKDIEQSSESIRYNLSGIRIPSGTNSIIIMNGKKILNK